MCVLEGLCWRSRTLANRETTPSVCVRRRIMPVLTRLNIILALRHNKTAFSYPYMSVSVTNANRLDFACD